MDGEQAHELPLPPEELLMAAGGGRVSILQGCCPEEAAYGPVDVPTPMYI